MSGPLHPSQRARDLVQGAFDTHVDVSPDVGQRSWRARAAIVERDRVEEVLDASRDRAERERVKRAKLEGGALSYELDGLRERVEGRS